MSTPIVIIIFFIKRLVNIKKKKNLSYTFYKKNLK